MASEKRFNVCFECGTPGDIGSGYGGYYNFSCPKCGYEWVDD